MRYAIGENVKDQVYGVDFIPNWRGLGPHITVWRGSRGGPGCVGATVSPADALLRHKKYFILADCEWFIPYVERLALGEEILIEDIQTAFANHNGGSALPKME